MLKLIDVTLKYHKKTILDRIDLTIPQGHTIGLLGLNGSGKSTLLSAMAGAKKPSSGQILLNQKSYAEDEKQYISTIGYVTQEHALIEELSAMDNLRLWTPMGKAEIRDTLQNTNLSILGVHTYLDLPVRDMSGGMKKRLSIAATLINKPRLLLLDEPFAALDLVAKQDISSFIRAFRSGGGTTVIASHDESVFHLCDEVYLLKHGTCHSLSHLPEGTSVTRLLRED